MSKSTPSLLALLGLVAVAGYQNRSKISEMLADARQRTPADREAHPMGQPQTGGGFMSEISNLFGGSAAGGTLASGLRDLVGQFTSNGRENPAETWVSTEANRPIDVAELEAAIGDDTLQELAAKTGLSRQELLLRLNAALPQVVDSLTPDGRLPTEDEARNYY